jgi:hypothetical protein
MVSDVIVPPARTADPRAGFLDWARLNGSLDPAVLALPILELMPAAAPVVEGERSVVGLRIWDVLAAWRAAERELAATAADSTDWPRVHADLVGFAPRITGSSTNGWARPTSS